MSSKVMLETLVTYKFESQVDMAESRDFKSNSNRQIKDIVKKVDRSCKEIKAEKNKTGKWKMDKFRKTNRKYAEKCKSEWGNKTSPENLSGKALLNTQDLMNENDMYEKEIRFRDRARARNWNRMQNKSTCETNSEEAVLVALGNVVYAEGDLLQWQFSYTTFTSSDGNRSGRFCIDRLSYNWV